MADPFLLLAIAGAFLIAGTVKSVIGLGLPTVSLAPLTVLSDLPSTMALLLAPSFVTNLWQAAVGGNGRVGPGPANMGRLTGFVLYRRLIRSSA
jgi:hypothetical protein